MFPEDSFNPDVEAVIAEYDLSLWVMGDALRARVPAPSPACLCGFADLLDGAGPARRAPAGPLDDAIFSIIHSSGTSGRSKALITTERGTADLIAAFLERFAVTADDTMLIYMPFSSYQQRKMVWGCAIQGAEMAVCHPTALFQAFQVQKPTIIIGPPSLFESLEAVCRPAGEAAGPRLKGALGGRARLLLSGMAKIKPSTLTWYQERGLSLFEVYGLNESGVISGNAWGANRVGTVGRPLDGTTVHISEDGEIIVEKEFPVCSGYFRPFSDALDTRIEGRLVYTGDLGSLDEDGFLTIRGRKKTTLVLGDGRKVQPEPVEKGLEEDGRVKHAVLFLNARATALRLVLDTGGEDADEGLVDAVRAAAARLLPAGMVLAEVRVSPDAFTAENGMLNRVLKVNRAGVEARVLS